MRRLSVLICLLLAGTTPALQAGSLATAREAVITKAKPAKKHHPNKHRRPKPHRKQG